MNSVENRPGILSRTLNKARESYLRLPSTLSVFGPTFLWFLASFKLTESNYFLPVGEDAIPATLVAAGVFWAGRMAVDGVLSG